MTLHGMIASHTAGTNMLINVTKQSYCWRDKARERFNFFYSVMNSRFDYL